MLEAISSVSSAPVSGSWIYSIYNTRNEYWNLPVRIPFPTRFSLAVVEIDKRAFVPVDSDLDSLEERSEKRRAGGHKRHNKSSTTSRF
jgi:hypothetical protein